MKKIAKKIKVKWPGLAKRSNSKASNEYIDFDYLDKLNLKQKDYLSAFNEEFLRGNFAHGGVVKHKTKKSRKECYGRNNSRNRDQYSRARAREAVIDTNVKAHMESIQTKASSEDSLISMLDLKHISPEEYFKQILEFKGISLKELADLVRKKKDKKIKEYLTEMMQLKGSALTRIMKRCLKNADFV